MARSSIVSMDEAANSMRAQTLEEMEQGSEPHGLRVPRLWRKFADGYPRFSAFLADDPDKTGTIFRRFDRTSARNLLYLENELSSLEARLDGLEDECYRNHSTAVYVRDWTALNNAADRGDTKAIEIRSLVIVLREKVREYRKRCHT